MNKSDTGLLNIFHRSHKQNGTGRVFLDKINKRFVCIENYFLRRAYGGHFHSNNSYRGGFGSRFIRADVGILCYERNKSPNITICIKHPGKISPFAIESDSHSHVYQNVV